MRGIGIRSIILAMVVAISSTALLSRAADSKKTDAAARDHVISVLNEAIKTLTGEFESHLKDSATTLREKADYFTEHPAPELTPGIVFDAIARNYNSMPETCYVRWQLLSFFDPTADKATLVKIAPQVGSLYARAPGPLPHPSLTPAVRAALDREAMRVHGDEVNKLNDLWNQKLADWVAGNTPILAYNDALYALLPDSFGKFKLGWSDLFDRRVAAGVPVATQYLKISADIGSWSPTALPADRRALAQMIARTSSLEGTDYPPKVYGQAVADDATHRVQFQAAPVAIPAKPTLDDLAKATLAGTAPVAAK